MRPFSSSSTLAWAMVHLSSSHAERYSQCASYSAACFLAPSLRLTSSTSARRRMSPTLWSESPGLRTWTSSTTAPLTTLRYGLSMKPYSLMRAKAGQRGDQTDVRAFRSFNRADAAVVRGMHVADFEPGALAAQTARSEGRKDAACA